jgi:hypothetical protein
MLFSMPTDAAALENQQPKCSISEDQMLGYWKGTTDNGFFEEFHIVNTNRSFSSWLHQRPAVNGTWSFNNCVFQIFGTMSFTYRVVSFKDSKLTLNDEEDNTTSVYLKIAK